VTWIDDTLAEFGRQLGIQSLGFGRHGVMQLELRSGAFLAVEPVRRGNRDEVLVYLGRPGGHDAGRLLRNALSKAHFSRGGPMAVQVALRGSGPDAIVLALVRLPERALTPQSLGHAVDYLVRWLDEAEYG
jgi:type III secretion system chaperone SycN